MSRTVGIGKALLGDDEDFLGHVLSRVAVADHAVGDADHARVVELGRTTRMRLAELRSTTGSGSLKALDSILTA